MLLTEQNVLVTGGARGLGAAITEALAREGAGVIINYRRSEAQARALVERLGPRVVAVQADITDEASYKHSSRTPSTNSAASMDCSTLRPTSRQPHWLKTRTCCRSRLRCGGTPSTSL